MFLVVFVVVDVEKGWMGFFDIFHLVVDLRSEIVFPEIAVVLFLPSVRAQDVNLSGEGRRERQHQNR